MLISIQPRARSNSGAPYVLIVSRFQSRWNVARLPDHARRQLRPESGLCRLALRGWNKRARRDPLQSATHSRYRRPWWPLLRKSP
jgi:hypothetical protein